MAWLIWLIAAVVLMVAELFSLELVLIMFSAGAFAASATAMAGGSLITQSLVFAIVSILALVVVRPLARKLLQRGSDETLTGIDALLGASAIVLKRVDDRAGLVKVNGEEWSARAASPEQVYQPGERVTVMKIKGATALVGRQS